MPFFCAVLRRFRAVFSGGGGGKERRIIGAQREEIGVRKGMEEAVRTVRPGGAGGCGCRAVATAGEKTHRWRSMAAHQRRSKGCLWGGVGAVSVRPGCDFLAEILPYSYYLVYLRI